MSPANLVEVIADWSNKLAKVPRRRGFMDSKADGDSPMAKPRPLSA